MYMYVDMFLTQIIFVQVKREVKVMASQQSGAGFGRNVGSRAAVFEQKQGSQSAQTNDNPEAFTGRGYVDMVGKDRSYGRPKEGSRTEYRGKQAGVHISNEVVDLCEIIETLGRQQPDGSVGVTFGELFDMYTKISNKLVGMLLRARKQKLIDFEGEMLFQRRDEHVVIRLLRAPNELRAEIEQKSAELAKHPTKHPQPL